MEGCNIDIATSQFALSQIIKEPIHLLSNSAPCIDLIFTSQPNLVMHSSVHSSLHPNCHHKIIFAKFNLFIFYPPPHKPLAWHYQQANTDLIKRAIELFDWEKILSNLYVNKQVFVVNETIMNIFENFIPQETITCNDKDPPRMNKQIKTLITERKIPCIPPIFHDNKFITDFKEKSEIFDSFFAKQCSLIDNGSTLPSLFPLITEKSLSDVDFLVEAIKNIISKLDSNKAHGDDMISIRMLKLWDKSICKPLSIIFKSCLTQGIFLSEWKKSNVVPVHKKNDKQYSL